MPSKAAQVLGQEPRNPTKVVVRPIKPAIPIKTPTKAPRSDTSKSLPVKLQTQATHNRHHNSNSARRNRVPGRRSPLRANRRSSNTENTPPVPKVDSSSKSNAPPTPPAKDTPPENKPAVRSMSPLRRAAPSDRLRENYEASVDAHRIPFPDFAFSPSPSKVAGLEEAGKSPTKFIPCTADEYQKLIAGEPLPWASLTEMGSSCDQEVSPMTSNLQGPMHMPAKHWSEGSSKQQIDGGSVPVENTSGAENIPHPERWSAEHHYGHTSHHVRHHSPLRSKFYSPSRHSVQLCSDAETPSKNVSAHRSCLRLYHLLEQVRRFVSLLPRQPGASCLHCQS